MRSPPSPAVAGAAPASRDAESIFRTKKIPEIRALEASTMLDIEKKREELRQLVGRSYRDLIDSADAIVRMKSSAESISSNLHLIDSSLRSLSDDSPSSSPPSSLSRSLVYATACRVKYLVDTPENIWGCLDESMLFQASARYLRATLVHSLLDHRVVIPKFPLLRHQWQIVNTFRPQISQRARDKLLDTGLPVQAYADALAAATTTDDLDPPRALSLFLDSRRSWLSQVVAIANASDPDSVTVQLCNAVRIIRTSLGQVGELFLQALNEPPLFYRTVLGSPPGTQLFGGIPNPEEEVRRWRMHMERLESIMVGLDPEYLAECMIKWLSECCKEIFGIVAGGRRMIDGIDSGGALACTEKLVREVLDSREGMERSLEQWLKSVFGSDIESPWDQIRGLILKDGKDLLEDTLEKMLLDRMKEIISLGFEDLNRDINIEKVVRNIVANPIEGSDFETYLKAPSNGGVWFLEPILRKNTVGYGLKPVMDENDSQNYLNAYLQPEVSQIRDSVDIKCRALLEDLLIFVESNNSIDRLKVLAPFLQERCQVTISLMLQTLDNLLGELSANMENVQADNEKVPPFVHVKRALFIGRLLLALRNHSTHIPLILSSPRQWVKDSNIAIFSSMQAPVPRSPGSHSPRKPDFDSSRSPRRQFFDFKRHTISAAAALFPLDDDTKPRYNELSRRLRHLCIKAHNLWISWFSNELSLVLSRALQRDDSLSATTSLKCWEVTVINQGDSSDGPLEMKIELPSMPSLYVTSFLFQACHEIHRIGGHVLDKQILQKFAWCLFEKVISVYQSFLTAMEGRTPQVSEKGILQMLLDLRFFADVLSGGKDPSSFNLDSNTEEVIGKPVSLMTSFRRKPTQFYTDSTTAEHVTSLVQVLSQKLDPIDWAIYETYLWENEKQSYKKYSVLFGFLIQLNRMHTDTAQKLPTKLNTESNILRCSSIPRFKYLPISVPALSSRGTRNSHLVGDDDRTSRSPLTGLSISEQSPRTDLNDNPIFVVSTPLLKSFMTQVGSRFGESTSRLGSMLTDAQVGMLRDRSAAAMSTFGDMLPGPAAGLLSSLTAGASRSDV